MATTHSIELTDAGGRKVRIIVSGHWADLNALAAAAIADVEDSDWLLSDYEVENGGGLAELMESSMNNAWAAGFKAGQRGFVKEGVDNAGPIVYASPDSERYPAFLEQEGQS